MRVSGFFLLPNSAFANFILKVATDFTQYSQKTLEKIIQMCYTNSYLYKLKFKRCNMAVSYNKLWKLLIDRKMKKKDLIALSGVSKSTIAKMGNDEHVSTEIIAKICGALGVDFSDIIEMVPDEQRVNTTENK